MPFRDVDVDKELPSAQARKLLAHILQRGQVVFSSHALAELKADSRDEADARNVLKAGSITEPAEHKKGSWRYRVHTSRMCVVISFDSSTLCVVVTAWMKELRS